MKSQKILCALAMAAAFPFHSDAGTLFYVPIPTTGSDAQSGIDSAKGYTSGVVAGKAKPGGRTVNGVELGALSGSGNASAAHGVTLSAATGTLTNGGGKTASIAADGAMAEVLASMIFNDGAADNSEQYVVLDPATLTAGKTYDLRVYVGNASGENRQVSLSFAGDSKAAVSTDFFNEDDATTSAGGFAEPNQVYYINYRFTWDGVSTPGFTATQKFGSMPFCLYALTNQEVGGDTDARPVGAVVAVQPERFAAAPATRRTRTTVVESDEDIGVSSDVFYTSDSLRRNGRWVTVGTYGRCWQPTEVDQDWQPYTRGRWVHSANDGWVWDSDEDFGWATYHYGRWFREEDSGWYWVPGRVWAPSWVSWRHGHSYIGWAPLPPVAIALAGVGISSWADHRWGIGPRAYNFVNVRDFGAPSMAKVLIPRQENMAIMSNTNNVTNIVNNRQGIYSGGPNFQAVNNALGRAGSQLIPSVQVNRNAGTKPLTPDGKFSQLTAGVLALTAPMVTRNKKSGSLPPVAATIATPKFDKGWNGLPDPRNSAALQAKIANEMPGATAKTAPAKLPGTPPATSGAAGSNAGGMLKPFRQGRPSDTTPPRPGQPAATAGGATFTKPGQPASTTTTGATFTKPGQPAKPPTDSTGNRRDTPSPIAQPGQPGNPTTATPTKPGQSADPTLIKPGQPVTSATDGVRKRGKTPTTPTGPTSAPIQPENPTTATPTKPGQPADPTLIKPGQPVTSATDGIRDRGKGSKAGSVPATQPTQPGNPANITPQQPGQSVKPPEGTPEAPRSKRRPGVPAAAEQVPGMKPTTPAVTPPEPIRPRKRLPDPATPQSAPPKVSTPAPAPVVPKPAPVEKRTPRPAPPVIAPVKPAAPIAQPNPRPPAPVTAPTRPAPPVAAPARPAPPVAAPARPAAPVPAPVKPAAPAPALPAKGGKPTPTPGPPTNG